MITDQDTRSVVVTASNAETIVKILNATSDRLNRAINAVNAHNMAEAEAASRNAQVDFERLARDFRNAGAGTGP